MILSPGELSVELRRGQGGYLTNRRAIVALSLLSIGCMGFVSLYQMGIIKHLPDPPLPMMNADKVDGSDEGYSHLQMPDSLIGLMSYSVTAALAGAGGKERIKGRKWLPLALAAKTIRDAMTAGRLTYSQFANHKAACFWCLLSAASTIASAFVAVPEARAALGNTRHNS